jgi:NAD(P)H-dependent FMN reductase
MICLISGTNRQGSNTLKIAQLYKQIYDRLNIACELLDLSQLPQDLLRSDIYSLGSEGFKESFVAPILASKGLHLIVPEYNGSFPGVLKLMIDLLPFPESFDGRPVCFTGIAAGQFGALRSVEQLQMIFAYRNACLFSKRVFLPAVHELITASGGLTDADLLARMEFQASDFNDFINALDN